MSNDPNFTGAAGPATEELIFDASEARRARRPSRIQRVGDHQALTQELSRQRAALAAFAKARAGKLIGEVLCTRVEKITAAIGDCTKAGTCASVKAGKLVDITTRCLCNGDHVCGNEYLYYPPLTKIRNATAAFTQMFAYQGGDLGIKWISIGQRGAFVGTFGR